MGEPGSKVLAWDEHHNLINGSVEDFWKSLSPEVAVAIRKGAPPLAGKWFVFIHNERVVARRDMGDRPDAIVLQEEDGTWSWSHSSDGDTGFLTRQAAQRACDEHFRARGWLLEGEVSGG